MARSHEDCLEYLEKIRWKGKPQCPYCESFRATKLKNEYRYHCNHCLTSFSVTVNTLFHNSRVKLHKWFTAIFLIADSKKRITARNLATLINVNKNTAASMISRIRDARTAESKLFLQIIKDKDEFWMGVPPKESKVDQNNEK